MSLGAAMLLPEMVMLRQPSRMNSGEGLSLTVLPVKLRLAVDLAFSTGRPAVKNLLPVIEMP